MKHDEIIQFAKEAGLLDCIDECYEERGDFVVPLIKLAELVIEDYKASLIPVGDIVQLQL